MTRGPYITIKIKDRIFEIGTEAEFNGPDAFDLLVDYLKEKYSIQYIPGGHTNGK
jgi:hypothetical protein